MRIPSRAEIDVEQIRRKGFYEFLKRAWHQVEPAKFVDNWHFEQKCKALEAVTRGECLDLIINEPPGSGKSLTVGVLWPVWEWACVNQETKWIYASFDQSLSRRDAAKALTLINSEWFKERFGELQISDRMGGNPRERVALTEYWTTVGGFRYSTSCPHGRVTGRHANRHVIDDPIKPMQAGAASFAVAEKALTAVSEWRKNTLSTRATDPKTLSTVLIMQRLHENDLSGEMLRSGRDVTHLRFPARYEADNPCEYDPRTEEGQLIWPHRIDDAALSKLEVDLGGKGTMNVEAQLQQRPSAKEGQIYKQEWFQYWTEMPKGFGRFVQSWDLTFKKEGTSRVCGDLWLIQGSRFYLIDWICERMSFSESLEAIEKRCTEDPLWKRAGAKLVENKANGPAVISMLEKKVHGLIAVEPQGSKEERASATTPPYQAKNVFHPHPSIRPDIKERETILKQFPRGRNDDEVDATSQFLLYAMQNVSGLVSAMEKTEAGSVPAIFGLGVR